MDHASVLTASVAVLLLAGPATAVVVSVLHRLTAAPAPRVTGIVVLCAAASGLGRLSSATAALPPPTMRTVDAPPAAAVASGYTVQPGDSLWAIACRWLQASGTNPAAADVDRTWRAIYAANRSTIGADPDLIHPGIALTIPEVRA